MSDPAAEHTRRRDAHHAAAAALARRQRSLSAARGGTALVALGVLWLAARTPAVSVWWLAVPATVFAALVLVHDRVIGARARAERAAAFHGRALARLDGTWVGQGERGVRFLADRMHPYVADLDVFGEGSLFQYLCTARTRAGQTTLAAWLAAPAEPDEIRARQAAVAELRPLLDLRETLALAGEDVDAEVEAERIAAWGAAGGPASRAGRGLVATAAAIAAMAVVAWAAGALAGWVLVVALGLEGAVALALRPRVARVLHTVELPARELAVLAELLAVIERQRFRAPRLAALAAALMTDGLPPSRQVARLGWLVQLLDARRNQLFAPIGWVLLWTTQLALAVEAWRAACGGAIGRWIAVAGELEALCALAAHAYEHPDDAFPELTAAGPRLTGEGLAHPLLPEARAVRNDVDLGDPLRVVVVSGSNMSGKSTWLRAIGTNVVLAQAGGTVRARRLVLSPLAVGAAIRVQDSLLEGTSRFYAEITRLRTVVALAEGPRPVLFLLDEILSGTNSHDRRIGAEAVVRGLAGRGAIGLVTTHDLALAQVADALGAAGANVHFADQLVDGALRFDYRLRPGVVARSNALALMRAVGLEV
ncbi:MAG: DNA mismatch repair protein MutS [Candidatus Binatia bacterium]